MYTNTKNNNHKFKNPAVKDKISYIIDTTQGLAQYYYNNILRDNINEYFKYCSLI